MFKDVFEMASYFSANSYMPDDYTGLVFRFGDELADIQIELQVSPVEEAARAQYRRLGEYLIKIGEAFKKEDEEDKIPVKSKYELRDGFGMRLTIESDSQPDDDGGFTLMDLDTALELLDKATKEFESIYSKRLRETDEP